MSLKLRMFWPYAVYLVVIICGLLGVFDRSALIPKGDLSTSVSANQFEQPVWISGPESPSYQEIPVRPLTEEERFEPARSIRYRRVEPATVVMEAFEEEKVQWVHKDGSTITYRACFRVLANTSFISQISCTKFDTWTADLSEEKNWCVGFFRREPNRSIDCVEYAAIKADVTTIDKE